MQRLACVSGKAVAVLVVGVLLVQQLPVQPLAHLIAGGPMQGCTEQVCHCKADRCICPHCTEHRPHGSTSGSADTEDGPALRSCGMHGQGPLGIFVLAKTLLTPALSAPALSSLAASYPPLRSAPVSHRRADDIFHPPKEHIG